MFEIILSIVIFVVLIVISIYEYQRFNYIRRNCITLNAKIIDNKSTMYDINAFYVMVELEYNSKTYQLPISSLPSVYRATTGKNINVMAFCLNDMVHKVYLENRFKLLYLYSYFLKVIILLGLLRLFL